MGKPVGISTGSRDTMDRFFSLSDFPLGYSNNFAIQMHRLFGSVLISSTSDRTSLKLTFARSLTPAEDAQLSAAVAAFDPSTRLPPGQTVAELAALQPTTAGVIDFARDARKNGESAGTGTGTLVYSTGSQWVRLSNDLPPEV